MLYTKAQWILIIWTSRFTAVLSILASLLLIYMILRRRPSSSSRATYRKRKGNRNRNQRMSTSTTTSGNKGRRRKRKEDKLQQLQNRLLLTMSTIDIFQSLAQSISTAAIPKSLSSFIYGASGTYSTCSLQAFFILIGLSIPNYTAMLCVYYVAVIRYNVKEHVLMKWEKWMHLYAIVPSLSVAFLGVGMGYLNAGLYDHCGFTNGCALQQMVVSDKDYDVDMNVDMNVEMNVDSNTTISDSCSTNANANDNDNTDTNRIMMLTIRIIAATIAGIAFIIIVVSMALVYGSVRKQAWIMKNKYQRFHQSPSVVSGTGNGQGQGQQGQGEGRGEGEDGEDRKDRENDQGRSRAGQSLNDTGHKAICGHDGHDGHPDTTLEVPMGGGGGDTTTYTQTQTETPSTPSPQRRRLSRQTTQTQTQRRSSQTSEGMERETLIQSSLYIASFLCTFTWPFLLMIQGSTGLGGIGSGIGNSGIGGTTTTAPSFWIMYMKAIFYPLQGVWNFVLYVRPRFMVVRERKKHYSFWWVLRFVVLGVGSSGSLEREEEEEGRSQCTGSQYQDGKSTVSYDRKKKARLEKLPRSHANTNQGDGSMKEVKQTCRNPKSGGNDGDSSAELVSHDDSVTVTVTVTATHVNSGETSNGCIELHTHSEEEGETETNQQAPDVSSICNHDVGAYCIREMDMRSSNNDSIIICNDAPLSLLSTGGEEEEEVKLESAQRQNTNVDEEAGETFDSLPTTSSTSATSIANPSSHRRDFTTLVASDVIKDMESLSIMKEGHPDEYRTKSRRQSLPTLFQFHTGKDGDDTNVSVGRRQRRPSLPSLQSLLHLDCSRRNGQVVQQVEDDV